MSEKPEWWVDEWKGDIHQGCLSCPPVEKVASMDMVIAVGFGMAGVTKDSMPIYIETLDLDEDDFWTVQNAENAAKNDPDHDWRIIMDAPLRGRTYQRHGDDEWVLINSNRGFA